MIRPYFACSSFSDSLRTQMPRCTRGLRGEAPEDWGYVFTHPEQFGDDGISAAHNVEDPAATEVILLEQVHHF